MSKNPSPADTDLLDWPEHLLKIVNLDKAAELSSLSPDTLKRNHADKIMRLSERRSGMRTGHALMIGTNSK